jgi:hypothetical protein
MTSPASFHSYDRIIQAAMEDAGLLQDGDEPTSEDYAKYLNRIHDLINFWQTKGIKLWVWIDKSVTLVAGQATYTLKPGGDVPMDKPLRVISGYFLDASGNKTPLTPLSWDEYTRLSQVTQQGSINSYFVNKLQSELSVSFWLVPDAQAALGTGHLILQQQITNATEIVSDVNFPQEWLIALRWGLAADICTGQPQAIIDRCEMKAAVYLAALEDWDVEDAPTFFQVDSRGGQFRGSFR